MMANQVVFIFFQITLIFICFPVQHVCQRPSTYGYYIVPAPNHYGVPHQVSLQYQDGFHFCSGGLTKRTVLGSHFVVSVAQCFQNNIYPVYAVVGDVLLGTNSTRRAQKRLVKKIVVHPDFNKNGLREHDIALLFLESDFLNDPTLKMHDASNSHLQPVDKLSITGWGYMFPGATNDSCLQVYSTYLRPDWDCQRAYNQGGKQVFKPGQMYCYYGPKENQNDERPCFGDPGAPVEDTYRIITPYPKFVGVVSFGHGKLYLIKCT